MTTINNSKEAAAQAKVRMEKAVEDFRHDLAGLRTGRANVALLDSIRVDYHGTPMPLNQLGTITVPDPMSILVAPWDPGAVPLIDKAIRSADLGLNPASDGKVVRVPIPALTEERRKELVKVVHKMAEEGRVSIRNHRRDANEALKKGASSGARMKVSEKGAVSIYGMGRFPVTLYKEQWLRLLDMSDEIRAFIAANEAQLKSKD